MKMWVMPSPVEESESPEARSQPIRAGVPVSGGGPCCKFGVSGSS
jgi:hypothetical protein